MNIKRDTMRLAALLIILVGALPSIGQEVVKPAAYGVEETNQLDASPTYFPIDLESVPVPAFQHAGYYRAHNMVLTLMTTDPTLIEDGKEKALNSIKVYLDEYPNHENLVNAFTGVVVNGRTSAGAIVTAVQEYNKTLDAIQAESNTLLGKASKDPYMVAIELYLRSTMEQVNTQIARQTAPLPETVEEPRTRTEPTHEQVVNPNPPSSTQQCLTPGNATASPTVNRWCGEG